MPWFDATVTGSVTETSVTFGGLQAGATIRVRVQAFDVQSWTILMVWCSSPPGPTRSSCRWPRMTLRLRPRRGPQVSTWFNSIRITWNGLDNNDGPMPVDFEHIEIHVSQVNDFTPDTATYVDTMRVSGTSRCPNLVYDVGYFVRFVAVDTAGNKSEPSADVRSVFRQSPGQYRLRSGGD